MPSSPFRPDDPREWLRRARGNLAYAKLDGEGVLNEDRAFNAQQAAEKALKALLLHEGVIIPFTHDLRELLGRLDHAGIRGGIPADVKSVDSLTPYAVASRYPGAPDEAVMDTEVTSAIHLAERVVEWASVAMGG